MAEVYFKLISSIKIFVFMELTFFTLHGMVKKKDLGMFLFFCRHKEVDILTWAKKEQEL